MDPLIIASSQRAPANPSPKMRTANPTGEGDKPFAYVLEKTNGRSPDSRDEAAADTRESEATTYADAAEPAPENTGEAETTSQDAALDFAVEPDLSEQIAGSAGGFDKAISVKEAAATTGSDMTAITLTKSPEAILADPAPTIEPAQSPSIAKSDLQAVAPIVNDTTLPRNALVPNTSGEPKLDGMVLKSAQQAIDADAPSLVPIGPPQTPTTIAPAISPNLPVASQLSIQAALPAGTSMDDPLTMPNQTDIVETAAKVEVGVAQQKTDTLRPSAMQNVSLLPLALQFQADRDTSSTGDGKANPDLMLPIEGKDRAPVTSGSTMISASGPAASDMSRAALMQVQEALRTNRSSTVELTLSPEELGRVRLGLSMSDGAMVISVSADRGETLDLLRRHSDELGRHMEELGYDHVSIDFGQKEQGEHQNEGSAQDPDTPSLPGQSDTPAARHKQIQLSIASNGGLDLRI